MKFTSERDCICRKLRSGDQKTFGRHCLEPHPSREISGTYKLLEALQRYLSYRAMLVAIVLQNSFVLVHMGYHTIIARYVAKWGIEQTCGCNRTYLGECRGCKKKRGGAMKLLTERVQDKKHTPLPWKNAFWPRRGEGAWRVSFLRNFGGKTPIESMLFPVIRKQNKNTHACTIRTETITNVYLGISSRSRCRNGERQAYSPRSYFACALMMSMQAITAGCTCESMRNPRELLSLSLLEGTKIQPVKLFSGSGGSLNGLELFNEWRFLHNSLPNPSFTECLALTQWKGAFHHSISRERKISPKFFFVDVRAACACQNASLSSMIWRVWSKFLAGRLQRYPDQNFLFGLIFRSWLSRTPTD